MRRVKTVVLRSMWVGPLSWAAAGSAAEPPTADPVAYAVAQLAREWDPRFDLVLLGPPLLAAIVIVVIALAHVMRRRPSDAKVVRSRRVTAVNALVGICAVLAVIGAKRHQHCCGYGAGVSREQHLADTLRGGGLYPNVDVPVFTPGRDVNRSGKLLFVYPGDDLAYYVSHVSAQDFSVQFVPSGAPAREWHESFTKTVRPAGKSQFTCDYFLVSLVTKTKTGTGPCPDDSPLSVLGFRVRSDPALAGRQVALRITSGETSRDISFWISDPARAKAAVSAIEDIQFAGSLAVMNLLGGAAMFYAFLSLIALAGTFGKPKPPAPS